MSERSERNLAKQVKSLEKESRKRDDALGDKVEEAGQRISRTQNAVVDNQNAIETLRSQSDHLRADVETLADRVSQGFEALGRLLRRMEEESREATLEIVEGIRAAEESSRRGLQQISTGVAIGDALKAAAEAEEIEEGMAEAAAELESARQAAELAIEEHRLDYDRASRQVYDDLGERLRELGRDVVRLQESLSQISEATKVGEAERVRHEVELRRAQLASMTRREREISAAIAGIDHEALTRVADAKRSLEAFLSDAALPAPAGYDGEPPAALGIPFIVVQAPDTVFNGENGRGEVYGPDCSVADCQNSHSQPPIPPDLGSRIQRMCSTLRLSPTSAVEPELKERLKSQMGELTRSGVLDAADAELIVAHLDAHPLHWLES